MLYILIPRGAALTSLPRTALQALLAWVLFSEPITAKTLAGIALTALGVGLVVKTAR